MAKRSAKNNTVEAEPQEVKTDPVAQANALAEMQKLFGGGTQTVMSMETTPTLISREEIIGNLERANAPGAAELVEGPDIEALFEDVIANLEEQKAQIEKSAQTRHQDLCNRVEASRMEHVTNQQRQDTVVAELLGKVDGLQTQVDRLTSGMSNIVELLIGLRPSGEPLVTVPTKVTVAVTPPAPKPTPAPVQELPKSNLPDHVKAGILQAIPQDGAIVPAQDFSTKVSAFMAQYNIVVSVEDVMTLLRQERKIDASGNVTNKLPA